MSTKVKICGLSRPCDITYVNEAKPDYCGFIINVPKSRRNVSPEIVRELVKELDSEIIPVGVFVNEPLETVAGLIADGTIRVAQLHGSEDAAYIAALRSLGTCTIFQAFRAPGEGEDVAAWTVAVNESAADLVLLDQGGGGTGTCFDWALAGSITRPYFLAGGIGAENVEEAIRSLSPYGVDLSSSVETDGVKDRDKINELVTKVRKLS